MLTRAQEHDLNAVFTSPEGLIGLVFDVDSVSRSPAEKVYQALMTLCGGQPAQELKDYAEEFRRYNILDSLEILRNLILHPMPYTLPALRHLKKSQVTRQQLTDFIRDGLQRKYRGFIIKCHLQPQLAFSPNITPDPHHVTCLFTKQVFHTPVILFNTNNEPTGIVEKQIAIELLGMHTDDSSHYQPRVCPFTFTELTGFVKCVYTQKLADKYWQAYTDGNFALQLQRFQPNTATGSQPDVLWLKSCNDEQKQFSQADLLPLFLDIDSPRMFRLISPPYLSSMRRISTPYWKISQSPLPMVVYSPPPRAQASLTGLATFPPEFQYFLQAVDPRHIEAMYQHYLQAMTPSRIAQPQRETTAMSMAMRTAYSIMVSAALRLPPPNSSLPHLNTARLMTAEFTATTIETANYITQAGFQMFNPQRLLTLPNNAVGYGFLDRRPRHFPLPEEYQEFPQPNRNSLNHDRIPYHLLFPDEYEEFPRRNHNTFSIGNLIRNMSFSQQDFSNILKQLLFLPALFVYLLRALVSFPFTDPILHHQNQNAQPQNRSADNPQDNCQLSPTKQVMTDIDNDALRLLELIFHNDLPENLVTQLYLALHQWCKFHHQQLFDEYAEWFATFDLLKTIEALMSFATESDHNSKRIRQLAKTLYADYLLKLPNYHSCTPASAPEVAITAEILTCDITNKIFHTPVLLICTDNKITGVVEKEKAIQLKTCPFTQTRVIGYIHCQTLQQQADRFWHDYRNGVFLGSFVRYQPKSSTEQAPNFSLRYWTILNPAFQPDLSPAHNRPINARLPAQQPINGQSVSDFILYEIDIMNLRHLLTHAFHERERMQHRYFRPANHPMFDIIHNTLIGRNNSSVRLYAHTFWHFCQSLFYTSAAMYIIAFGAVGVGIPLHPLFAILQTFAFLASIGDTYQFHIGQPRAPNPQPPQNFFAFFGSHHNQRRPNDQQQGLEVFPEDADAEPPEFAA